MSQMFVLQTCLSILIVLEHPEEEQIDAYIYQDLAEACSSNRIRYQPPPRQREGEIEN